MRETRRPTKRPRLHIQVTSLAVAWSLERNDRLRRSKSMAFSLGRLWQFARTRRAGTLSIRCDKYAQSATTVLSARRKLWLSQRAIAEYWAQVRRKTVALDQLP